MNNPIQVLIVEDSKIDAALVLDELRSGGFEDLIFKRVETRETFKAALEETPWDVIISDYSMPSFTALNALKILQDTGLDIPFIIVSGSIGEEIAVEALKQGAQDYIMKDNPRRLAAAVEREIREVEERKLHKKTEGTLVETENVYQRLVEAVKDYGIIMLDPGRRIVSWNVGAERITGYPADEILGQEITRFYLNDDIQKNTPNQDLTFAAHHDQFEGETRCVRKDGTVFNANVSIHPVYEESVRLAGFSLVIQDITVRKQAEAEIQKLTEELEQKVRDRTAELEGVNSELESFSFSISHDLRAPMRNLIKLSDILINRYADSFNEQGRQYLVFIQESSQRMMQLVNDLLNLSKVNQREIARKNVSLSDYAQELADKLHETNPERKVTFKIADNIIVKGDPVLLRNVLDNLLGNAWKFTSKRDDSIIEFGTMQLDGSTVYFVRDNGVGFNPAYSDRLFGAFQRLHGEDEFPGSGIGLATVKRIIHRHRGRVWAEGAVDKGATFYFTLP